MAWRCHPRGLLRTPGWPKGGQGNQGRILEEKRHIFKALGRTKMCLKHTNNMICSHSEFCVWEPFGSILDHFGSHVGALERHGDSKWLSKGPAREPEEFLEPWEKAGRKSDDFGGPRT